MKKRHAWILYIALGINQIFGAEERAETVTERGPHHRVVKSVMQQVLRDGSVLEQKSTRIDLTTGMHYRDGDAWAESKELIEQHPNGAIAHYGPTKAAFSANLNARDAVQLVDSEGKQFTSHLLGLAYTDAATGQSVLIAQVKDSVGEIVPPNQIVYRDAFSGAKVDVRYTFRREGVEQDIIIREALPTSPADYGFDPVTTRLEVFTEFTDAPEGRATAETLRMETDPIKRQAMALPDFVDETLHFGALQIGKGKAVDFQGVVPGDIPVGKSWEVREGRTFLIEAVEFPTVQPALNALPRQQANVGAPARMARVALGPNKKIVRPFPAAPKQQAAVDRKPMKQVASLNLRPGVLLDWVITLDSGLTNYVFRPEVTYSVSGTINLYGTNTIRGGTIIKYAVGGILNFNGGAVVCDTTPYHPAVFTASTEDTMGDFVSTGPPSGYYATAALRASSTVAGELHDLRFVHAATAIDWTGSADRFYNLQFINCSTAMRRVNATNAAVHNILATNVTYLFVSSNSSLNVQHLTANKVTSLGTLAGSLAIFSLTNSILINVGVDINGTRAGDYIATNGTVLNVSGGISVSHAFSAPFPVFEASVGGYHYLSTNSGLRDVGTTNIAANLLSEIRSLTTYAPTLLTSTASVNVTFSPIVPRDTVTPCLGYHYTPLDYVLRGYRLNTNVVLTMTNGVAIGMDFSDQNWGLIFDSATNISIGSPTNMNRIVRAHCVQERSTGNPGTRAMFYDIGDNGTHGDSEARFRFTEFANMAQDGYVLYTGGNWLNWEWSHCWIYNLSVVFTAGKDGQNCGVTNNIFEGSDFTPQPAGTSSTFHFRNNLFRWHNLNISDLNSSSTMRDNLFDNQLIYTNGTTVTHSHNAYYRTTNGTYYATNGLPGLGNNLPLDSLAYETGPYGTYGRYGRYYQPTASLLLNAGSQNATNAGLYHFTTTTNQAPETNSMVDIGPHFVALDAQGRPNVSNTNNVPNYLADVNGNGIIDAGEIPFTSLSVSLTSPVSGTNCTAPADITVSASVSAPFTPVTLVEFYSGETKIGESTSAPYTMNWSSLLPGTYTLTARATASAGLIATSAPVTLYVNGNALFVVGSTNLPGTTVPEKTDYDVWTRLMTNGVYAHLKGDSDALSADADGKLLVVISRSASAANVGTKFTSNGVPLLTWNDQLYDDLRMVTNSADIGTNNHIALIITNTTSPMATNLSGSNVVVGVTASFSWGRPTSNAVRVATLVLADTNKIGIFGYETNAAMPDMDAPARRVGFFLGHAASTNLNTTGWSLFDAAVQWATNANAPPIVNWVTPTNGSSFLGGTNITLKATASDNDSGLKRVNFYRDGVRVGTANAITNSTNSFIWSNVPGGTYFMTAKAVDNGGLTTVSTQFINLTVQTNILFIVNSATLNTSETWISNRLSTNGFLVTVKAAASSATSDADGKSLVLISSSVTSSDVGSKFTKGATPVIVWKKELFDDLGLTSSSGFGTTNVLAVSIPAGSVNEPMAAGLSGIVTVVSNSTSLNWANPGSNAIVIATVTNDASKVILFGYEKGDLMYGLSGSQLAAPGRRVGFMPTSDNAKLFNTNGWKLFDAAVEWAMGKPCYSSVDVMLIIDRSGSMKGRPLIDAKRAATNFTGLLNLDIDQAGVVSFVATSTLNHVLSQNFTSLVSAINSVTNPVAGGRMDYAIQTAQTELSSTNHNTNSQQVIVLLSDGVPTYADGTTDTTLSNLTISAATQAKDAGTRIITIGFGKANPTLLQVLASTPTDYYFAPVSDELMDVYVAVAEALCRFSNPPTIVITNPVSGTIFNSPTDVTIDASASDLDGYVTQVIFFSGTTSLGIITNAPFSLIWSNPAFGVYTLTAIATDNSGLVATSAPVEIIVRAPPAVSIVDPTNTQEFLAPATIIITATAADPDGTVTNVSIYSDTTKLTDLTSAPFTFQWTNVFDGAYALKAIATDNHGLSTTSTVVNITVLKQAPVISILSPTDGTALAAPASFQIKTDAHDYDGTVTNVQFFSGTTSLGNVTNLPFHLAWTNVSEGSYTLSAVAKDDDGLSTTSAPVALTVASCTQLVTNTLTLNPTSTVAGATSTGTVTLTSEAITGGQAVTLWADSPDVSIPASVLIPMGATNLQFTIETRSRASAVNVNITATTSGNSSTQTLFIAGTGYKTTDFSNQCGPMDVAVLVDVSSSMSAALNGVKTNVANMIKSIEFASGGDYRLALVSIDNNINVEVEFAQTNWLAFSNALQQLEIVAHCCEELSEEAINTVINALPTDAGRNQIGDFATPFRENARRVIILISDEPPAGLSPEYVPEVGAHSRAVEAYSKGIQINQLVPPFCCDAGGELRYIDQTTPIAEDYARTTGGEFFKVNPIDPNDITALLYVDVDLKLQQIIGQCGAAAGSMIFARDDTRHVDYSALTLSDMIRSTNSVETAAFDLSGISGEILAAHLQRSGQLRANEGSRFDLQLGVTSALTNTLASFGPVVTNVTSMAVGSPYTMAWELPFSFYPDIQARFESLYPLYLSDRASGACGNNYQVVDSPHADFPFVNNVLSLRIFTKHEIPQGRCRDLVLTGTNAPSAGTWEILLFDTVIASPCDPGGWSVEPDYSVYGGVNVCAPTDALTANRYEVRFNDDGIIRSGAFAVVSAALFDTAPVLKPIVLSPVNAGNMMSATAILTLDSPARGEGAFVALTSSSVTNGAFPASIYIPPGESSANFSFPVPVTDGVSNRFYEIAASYNGVRKAMGVSVEEAGEPPDSPSGFSAQEDVGLTRLSWTGVNNAFYYRIERTSPDCDGTFTTIADRVTGTCYTDHAVEAGTTNCYRVVAVNSLGELAPSSCSCATAVDALLRPLIIPNGGKFNDYVDIQIQNFTPGATVYFTTNGLIPATNDFQYTNSFRLTNTTTISAMAFLGTSTSLVARADFVVAQSAPLACGNTTNSSLTALNWPSTARGPGYYVQRFAFPGTLGYRKTISMASSDFTTHLYLIDPSGTVVAEADDVGGFGSQIVYTARTNGTFIIEATTHEQFQTGDFTLLLLCEPSPELDVLIDAINVTNRLTLDLGITPISQNLQKAITLTNSGTTNLFFSAITVTPSAVFSLSPSSVAMLTNSTSTNLTLTFNSSVTGAYAGTLSLTSDTGDNGDGVETPFLINFLVRANPAGTPPTVLLTSPTNNEIVAAPGSFTVTADASATSPATVSQVNFYQVGPNGTVLIGTDSTSPYLNTWNVTKGGNYTIRAEVIDSEGRFGLPSSSNVLANDRPVAVADRISVRINSGANQLFLPDNDFDPNNDSISITGFTQATNGTVSLDGGIISYAPTNGIFGRDYFTYIISDSHGATATGAVSVVIRPDGSYILVEYNNTTEITSPLGTAEVPAEITAPVTVTGSASSFGVVSGDFLDYWELDYRRCTPGPERWTTLSTGVTNVQNSTLGVFDPTLLPNGLYELRITVVDYFGSSQDSRSVVTVTRANKIGHFTLSFTDLQIPVSGLPITITRTYDSRDTTSGDFGAGWNLDISSVRLEKSGLMGEGWVGSQSFVQHCLDAGELERPQSVTITFPDGKVYRFRPSVALNYTSGNCTVIGGLSGAAARMVFVPLPGTIGSLVALNGPDNLAVNTAEGLGWITLHEDRGDLENPFGPIYDPAEFLFTTLDGRQFQFNANGKLVKMSDRAGNSITISADGVIHSSGKSVKFVRNASGFITRIYDPIGLDSSGNPSGAAALLYDYDNEDNLVKVHRLTDRTDPANPRYVTTTFLYENPQFLHYITAIKDPRGVTGIRNEYDQDGRLISNTDADGKVLTYVHDQNGKTETVVDRLGFTNIFKYDAKGNVTNTVNALDQTNSYTFDANDQKTHEVIAGVLTNAFVYDGNQLLTESVVGELITNKFTYNQFGQVLAALDGLGRGATNFYDALGNLTATTNALGFTNGFTYDAAGNQIGSVDSLGTRTTNRYDLFGNLTNSVTESLVAIAYSYDANGNRTTEVQLDAASLQPISTNVYLYDGQNRVIGVVDSFGRTNGTTFNEIGQVAEMTDKTGKVTRYEYDSRGNPSKVIHPDNTSEQFTYDAEGNLTNRVDRAGRSTGFVYDALNRLIQTIYPDVTSTRTIYDELGRVKFTVDARAVTNAFGYDAAGRHIAMTNAWGSLNQWSTNAYDAAGNLVADGDANGRVTDFAYNAENQRVKITYPTIVTGQARPFLLTAYDAEGRRTIETNESSIVTGFQYQGALGLLVSVTNAHATADKAVTRYAYDVLGRQTNQMDALGRRTAFEFDAEGRRLRRLLPGSQSEGFGYDAESALLRQTNFNGQIITNLYDAQNRLASHWHGSTQLVAFTYTVTGQRATMNNEAGVVTWVYDNRDRVRTNSTPAGTLYYDYDANGNLTRLWTSTASGTDVTYEYDALNRITNVIDNQLIGTKNTRYGFDGVGNLTSLNYPNGVTNEWQYDARNRLTNLVWKLSTSTNASFAYLVEAAGYRTRLDETVNSSNRVYQWSYDNLYRLKNEIITGSGPTGAVSYAYDAVGNRTNRTSTIAGILTTNNYFDANDWLDIDSTTNNSSAWFDSNGNTRTNGAVVYLYDWANRLTNAVIGTTNIAIVYNGDGQRVKKTVTVGTTTNVTLYLVDDLNPTGYAQVVEESTVSSGVTNLGRAYTYGLDLISQRLPGVSTNFYGYDGSGSTRFLTGPGGAVTDTCAYDAFGTVLANTGTTANNYRFQGEQWDADLRLAFHRARYYLPEAGRWLTMDSWEGNNAEPLSLHKYASFHNSPLNGTDPSGHDFNISTVLTTTTKGAWLATRVASSVYTVYDRVSWLRDGVQILSGALATGTVNPAAAGLWMSDFIPWGKALRRAGHFVGKVGNLPGVGAHLTSVMKGLQGIGNKGKDHLGMIAAKVTARAKGLQDIGYVPRGNGGFDDVFKDKDGYFVVVESKFGLNPRLNPATDTNPAQMSYEWIQKNVRNLGENNKHIAQELEQAFEKGRVRGMVVKTKVDPNGNVLDPEFEIKDVSEIGKSWNR